MKRKMVVIGREQPGNITGVMMKEQCIAAHIIHIADMQNN